MEDDDVGATELEVLQAAHDALWLVEQIADQHHHAALGQRVGELMKRPRDVGLAAGLQAIEGDEERAQMAWPGARRQHGRDAVVKGGEANGVALPVHQVAERRGQALRVFELGDGASEP